MTNKTITVETVIDANIEKVWEFWTRPDHITQWNFASDDWECPHAENELKTGGKFKMSMSAKDGTKGFDFEGTYTQVMRHKQIDYVMVGDNKRKVTVTFTVTKVGVKVSETFDKEQTNSEEIQRNGWQAIRNFRFII